MNQLNQFICDVKWVKGRSTGDPIVSTDFVYESSFFDNILENKSYA